MNVAIDFGNTSAKVGIFEDHELKDRFITESAQSLKEFLSGFRADHAIISSVKEKSDALLSWISTIGEKIVLSPHIPLPITIRYQTPETLGVDRIAGVCGALEILPSMDVLVVDAGSCITYDFVDRNGNYFGGAISPGIQMRFKALQAFTERLPLVSAVSSPPLIGSSTTESIQSGVINGITGEIASFISGYKKQYPDLHVIACGGDAGFLEKKIPGSSQIYPDLVLIGLNRILRHNLGQRNRNL